MGLSNQYECNKFLDKYLGFLNQEIADELAHYCPGQSSIHNISMCVQSKWFPGTACQASFTYLLLRSAGYSPLLSLWSFLGRMAFFFVSASFPWQLGQTTHQWPIKKGPFILLWLLGLGLMVSLLHFSSSKEAYGKRKFDSLNQDILTFIS